MTTMTTTTATYTPWGWTHDVVELAEGVWRVWTPGHGGLKLSRERWDELPAAVRDAMLTPTFAEEDCEESIVRLLLGVADDRDREIALTVAGYFDRYAPALPFVRCYPPGLHYHAIAFCGGLCSPSLSEASFFDLRGRRIFGFDDYWRAPQRGYQHIGVAARMVGEGLGVLGADFAARHHAPQQVAQRVVGIRLGLAWHTYIQAVSLRPTLFLSPLWD